MGGVRNFSRLGPLPQAQGCQFRTELLCVAIWVALWFRLLKPFYTRAPNQE
jgi:hypothetical protein